VLSNTVTFLVALAPALALVVILALALAGTDLLLRTRERRAHRPPFARLLIMIVLTATAVVLTIVALPVRDAIRQQLLSLLGLVLTGVVAFASTTFVSNAMAGLMLRAVGNLHPGDWVRVGRQFGRVTERGLFHVEIQTEDSDLATLPNMYLVTQPVTVVRTSGTVVAAELSLGYDAPRDRVEACLLDAARGAGLEEPFVRILELGDFSVRYRVAGLLREVKRLLQTRSDLRVGILDALHGAGVEIVSPTFVTQRRLDADAQVLPATSNRRRPRDPTANPEGIIFEKAEQEAAREALRAELADVEARLADATKRLANVGDDEAAHASIQAEATALERRRDEIRSTLEPDADETTGPT